MKNNILLILAVTIISIGIIIATVVISTAGGGNESSRSESKPQTTSRTTASSEESKESSDIVILPYTEEAVESAETHEASSSLPSESTPDEVPHSEDAVNLIATAHSLIGIDFVDGGDTPEVGFDNSGFVYYVLRENGYITCPRELTKQSDMGTALSYSELRPGDLAYFYADDMATIGFGGIYCGDGVMIACLMPGTQVKEINITTPYYTSHFYRGVSLF